MSPRLFILTLLLLAVSCLPLETGPLPSPSPRATGDRVRQLQREGRLVLVEFFAVG